MKSKVDFKIFVHLIKIQINTECKVVKLFKEVFNNMVISFSKKLVLFIEANGKMEDQTDGDKISIQMEAIMKVHSLMVFLTVQEDL